MPRHHRTDCPNHTAKSKDRKSAARITKTRKMNDLIAGKCFTLVLTGELSLLIRGDLMEVDSGVKDDSATNKNHTEQPKENSGPSDELAGYEVINRMS
jgi:hypothetical protein